MTTYNNAINNSAQSIQAIGGTNAQLTLYGKGNLGVASQGRSDGNGSSVGYIGETISSLITASNSITLSTSTNTYNITSINVTAGNWILTGNFFAVNTSQSLYYAFAAINEFSATLPDDSLIAGMRLSTDTIYQIGGALAFVPVSITVPTTYYLCVTSQFASGTTTACGLLQAIRVS